MVFETGGQRVFFPLHRTNLLCHSTAIFLQCQVAGERGCSVVCPLLFPSFLDACFLLPCLFFLKKKNKQLLSTFVGLSRLLGRTFNLVKDWIVSTGRDIQLVISPLSQYGPCLPEIYMSCSSSLPAHASSSSQKNFSLFYSIPSFSSSSLFLSPPLSLSHCTDR